MMFAPTLSRGGCNPPAVLPDFALPLDIENRGVIAMRDIRRRPALIYFFAPDTPQSLRMLPAVERAFERYHAHGLVVIGMQQPEAPSMAKPSRNDPAPVRRRYHLAFPVARDISGAESLFCVSALPTAIFTGRDGRIVRFVQGVLSEHALDAVIRELLARG